MTSGVGCNSNPTNHVHFTLAIFVHFWGGLDKDSLSSSQLDHVLIIAEASWQRHGVIKNWNYLKTHKCVFNMFL